MTIYLFRFIRYLPFNLTLLLDIWKLFYQVCKVSDICYKLILTNKLILINIIGVMNELVNHILYFTYLSTVT